MIKALLLDFDGLMVDTESPEVEIWRELYAMHGLDFPLETWISRVVGSISTNFDPADHLVDLKGDGLDAHALRQQAQRLRDERMKRLPALPGVEALLADGKRLGLRLAVVSSSPHWWVEGFLEPLGLRNRFECIICREDAPRVKPAPDLYLEAVRQLGLASGECLAFEDSVNGVRAAQQAGMRVVGVPNAITSLGAPLPAEKILRSLGEMPLEELVAEMGDLPAWAPAEKNP